ncbi:hypothetical protein RKD26_004005 [Streptomyces calvus]
MVPPVHMRTFFAFGFFFAGLRPRRPDGGSSAAPPRRLRCGGTSAADVSRAAARPEDCVRPRRAPAEREARCPGTVGCGAELPSRNSYSPVSGLSTHWSAGSTFSARPRPCASTVA